MKNTDNKSRVISRQVDQDLDMTQLRSGWNFSGWKVLWDKIILKISSQTENQFNSYDTPKLIW